LFRQLFRFCVLGISVIFGDYKTLYAGIKQFNKKLVLALHSQ